jgi:hypothetical protein
VRPARETELVRKRARYLDGPAGKIETDHLRPALR